MRLFTDPVAKELVGVLTRYKLLSSGMRNLIVGQTDAVFAGERIAQAIVI